MSEEFQYVRAGWSMGTGDTLDVRVRIDPTYAEKFSESQWKSLSIEVEKHMKTILDFLENEIWPDQQKEEK